MKNKNILFLSLLISMIGNIWLGISYFQTKFLIENAVVQEMYQEAAKVDMILLLSNSKLKKDKVISLLQNQLYADGEEIAPPVLEENKLIRHPLDIAFDENDTFSSVIIV